jgi:hypothetical protein
VDAYHDCIFSVQKMDIIKRRGFKTLLGQYKGR